MNMLAFAINAAERAPLSDTMTLAGIDMLCARTKRRLAGVPAAEENAFVTDMAKFPVATHTDEANRQHYEVPAEFFAIVLGAQRKYSCCFYPNAQTTLDEAETLALEETVSHARLQDGMNILELGCGWGSLSLYMAGPVSQCADYVRFELGFAARIYNRTRKRAWAIEPLGGDSRYE